MINKHHLLSFLLITFSAHNSFGMGNLVGGFVKRTKDNYYGHDVMVHNDLNNNPNDRSKLPLKELTHEAHRVEWGLQSAAGKDSFYEIEKLRKARNLPINRELIKRMKEEHRKLYPLAIQKIIDKARGKNKTFKYADLNQSKKDSISLEISGIIHEFVKKGETIHIQESLKLCKQHNIPLSKECVGIVTEFFKKQKEKRIEKSKIKLAIILKKIHQAKKDEDFASDFLQEKNKQNDSLGDYKDFNTFYNKFFKSKEKPEQPKENPEKLEKPE